MTESEPMTMTDAIKEIEDRIKSLEATERDVLAELRAQEITLGIVSKKVLRLSEELSVTVNNQTRIILDLGDLMDRINYHISRPYCHKER